MSDVLIVAAEASSALYAQRLLEHWKGTGVTHSAFGIGSRAMEDLGFEVLGRSEELAVVGVQEVIAHWGDIKSAFDGLLEEAKKRKPKVALLLDYPDFNLRLAKKLKKLGIPVVYYISPQIWAWRQSRVHKIRALVDQVLVLFPFEKEFYDQHNVPSTFVGHPLLDELDDKYFDTAYRNEKRARYGLKQSDVVLGLMPGSRRSEIKHHLQTQLQTAAKLKATVPGLRLALLVAPTFDKQEVQQWLEQANLPIIVVKDEPFEMVNVADVTLCASGTATLIVGLMEKPMVIMYKMNALTAYIAKKFVNTTKYFGMINLILDREVAPELFQERANPELLAQKLTPYLTSEDLRIETAKELSLAKDRLGDKGATTRVADALKDYLQ